MFHQLAAFEIARLYGGLDGFQEALRWDPQGADYHFRLGLLYRDDPRHRNLEQSQAHLQKATELNPYAWWYWLQLAGNYEVAGVAEASEAAFRRAVEINPIDAGYRWRIANFFLREGALDEALLQFQRAIELEPARYLQSTLMLLWKAGTEVEKILEIWPEEKDARLTLLRFSVQQDLSASRVMDRLWAKLFEGPENPTVGEGEFYIMYLIKEERYEEAKQEWTRLNGVDGFGSLIWNGDFALPITGLILDWKATSSAAYTLEQKTGQTGIEIAFNGSENLDFNGLQQVVAVESNRDYKLSFGARSREISTEQGLYFEVVGGRVLAETEKILGTTPWTEYSEEFRVPEGQNLVTVRLRRRSSRRIDNKLRGRLWLDGVKLVATDSR